MQDALLSALTQGALLLTANRRLTRHWRHAYDAARMAEGARAWPAPAVHSWSDWIGESIEALLPDRITPSPFAEHRGWYKVIDDGPLLDREATAEGCAKAWALCQQYELPLDHAAFDQSEDTAKFRAWASEFERRVDRNRWLPAARREHWLAEQLPETHREVWLDGFDETTPAQRALLSRLRYQHYEGVASPARSISRTHYPDTRAELRAAASWARTLLERGEATSVGIVVPALARIRPAVEATFEDVLGGPLFNISLGLGLTEWPLIADALLWLRWLAGPIDVGRAGVLLRSPFFQGAGVERGARALLDLSLRDDNVLEVAVGRVRSQGPPLLAESLGRAIQSLAGQPGQQSPAEWARFIPLLLTAGGWPGDRTLSSAERQASVRWRQLLQEFAALDAVEPAMPFAEAISLLTRLAGETIFQPEIAEMPVQILEALQAAGSRFDALWVMGMTDSGWPAPAKPNPFLPRALQREFDLPHATPERELRFAHEVTDRLLRSAETVIFSYPERDGDEELRASRLILPYPEVTPPMKSFAGYGITGPMEESTDASAPARPDKERVRGGTNILAWQSQCPFRAFAAYRLQASEWPEPEPGLSAMERGTALHGALAVLWKRFQSRSALAAAGPAAITAAIAEAVDAGCAELPAQGRERLLGLERLRMRAVLADWIELDFQRGDFTVEKVEFDFELDEAGIPIRGRADRIDRLPGGEVVLIDYKSTAPSKKVWSGERPDDLQLPLYAITLPETPSAIAFAQLKRGEHKFDGFGAREGLMPGVKPPPQGWDQQLTEWRETIARIWSEFEEGRAVVDPKDGGKPCEQCHLHSLCRIYDGK